MGRDATKAAGNPWYQARKKAAEYDDRLCSRESAAEQLGMSVSSLADAELGNTKFMPVDKAVLMADRYNAPWLLNHYCLNECPIGCRHSLSDEVVGIDRVTVKLLKSLKTEKLGDVKDTLLDIAADGKITEDEKPALQEVLAYLDDLAKTVSELKTIGEMALNEDGDAHGSKYLSEKPYGVSYRDFLDVTKKEIGTINRVVMNPPFTRHQDIDHVRHAYDLLDAGGILVAIMCESTFFRTDKKSVEFRDFLDSVYAQAIKLEPGAFRESGTDVVTRIVKIRKPM